MECELKKLLRLKYEPVAVIWSDEKPLNAIEFKQGKWGCVMWLFISSAKGKTAVFSRETYGCWGGGVGLGFGNLYSEFPGGVECFCNFLSSGNADDVVGQEVVQNLKPYVTPEFLDDFLEGERYLASPKNVKMFIENLPIVEIPSRYVVFKPLSKVESNEERPKVVVFLVEPHQLASLIVLSHYNGDGKCRVFAPFSAGCQTIGIWAYTKEGEDFHKAIIGLTDISARLNVKKQIGDYYFTLAFPWEFFLEIEEYAYDSFLTRNTWRKLISER
ncbi:MAG: DUF169 domain-containing protein [Candidatus Hydrogenedentes bacterium]|nr:DUF169 domain-containing protein [Candidatus Hydrogenedentota bacterium]